MSCYHPQLHHHNYVGSIYRQLFPQIGAVISGRVKKQELVDMTQPTHTWQVKLQVVHCGQTLNQFMSIIDNNSNLRNFFVFICF